MKIVAQRQGISLKYLEKILPMLVAGALIEGIQGKKGGYRLVRSPEQYRVGEILRVVEGDLAPVACLECGAAPCPRESQCRTIALWRGLDRVVRDYLDGVTLADLTKKVWE